jgi:hypothetical protein
MSMCGRTYSCSGYLCSQIPGAGLIQTKGPKLILGLTMIGTCGIFTLTPALARLRRTIDLSERACASWRPASRCAASFTVH